LKIYHSQVEKQAEIIKKQAMLIEQQAETIKALEAHIAGLKAQIVELQTTIARLQKDSRNSSKLHYAKHIGNEVSQRVFSRLFQI
jgi:uncharacterized protein HemX